MSRVLPGSQRTKGHTCSQAVSPGSCCQPCEIKTGNGLCEFGEEEGQEPKVPSHGVKPSQEEIDRHNATHIPFRNWCPFCVAGKAKDNPHFSEEVDPLSGVNVVQIDYLFLGDKEENEGPVVEDADEEDADSEREEEDLKNGKTMPVLVLRDRKHKYITARVVPRKGRHPYTVRRLGQDITQILGYNRVHIKSDQEPAVKKLKAQVRLEYSIEVPEEESRVGDSQSNGEIENTNQQVQAQIRTQKAHLEHRLGEKVPMDSDLLPWMVSHSGASISRFHVGKDGFTAHRRLKGRSFTRRSQSLRNVFGT